jgi:tRNA (adenine22-N1)-methyltransferase
MVKSKRIRFIASLLKGYPTVLDIGSDHGYVLKEALDQGYIQRGIASEIAPKPLERAKKTLQNYPVRFVLSDGFLHISDTYDAVVIAGMGAYVIQNILKHSPKIAKRYILLPHDHVEDLRLYLASHQFHIIEEYVLYEKHYYNVLVVEHGTMELSLKETYVGKNVKPSSDVIAYYDHMTKKYDALITKVNDDKQTIFMKIKALFKEAYDESQ